MKGTFDLTGSKKKKLSPGQGYTQKLAGVERVLPGQGGRRTGASLKAVSHRHPEAGIVSGECDVEVCDDTFQPTDKNEKNT